MISVRHSPLTYKPPSERKKTNITPDGAYLALDPQNLALVRRRRAFPLRRERRRTAHRRRRGARLGGDLCLRLELLLPRVGVLASLLVGQLWLVLPAERVVLGLPYPLDLRLVDDLLFRDIVPVG